VKCTAVPCPPIVQQRYVYRAGDLADWRDHLRSGFFKLYAVSEVSDEYVDAQLAQTAVRPKAA
jgi:hypothetical protein